MKILFSNLGYARGIDGSLWQHVSRFSRHFYCPVTPQQDVLNQLKSIIKREQPDLCCFVEIDQGAFHSSYFNQMEALRDDVYCYSDAANKYGDGHWYARLPLHTSKSNGFLAKQDFTFEKLFFRAGRKRLVYRLRLPGEISVYFAHFSLKFHTRKKQFEELRDIILHDGGPSLVLADFNIFNGFSELSDLLKAADLKILNRDDEYTFTFYKRRRVLDLCLASSDIAARIDLKIIPQPYSDHAALCLELKDA